MLSRIRFGRLANTRRTATFAFAALMLCACGASGTKVTSAEYGDRWPFTIDEGTLRCDAESRRSRRLFVTLDDGTGIMYALNGSARSFGYPDHKSILKPGKTGADLRPFIERGLTLCEPR